MVSFVHDYHSIVIASTSALPRLRLYFCVTSLLLLSSSVALVQEDLHSSTFKYLGSINTCNSEGEEGRQNVVLKRRKVVVSETEEECTNHIENKIWMKTLVSEVLEGSHLPSPKSDANIERSDPLSLVKLTRSGLLLLTFSHGHCPDVVHIVSNMMQSLKSGSLKAPLWCHRILRIQSTCVLHEKELCTLASKLVADFMDHEGKELARRTTLKLLLFAS